MTENCDKIPVTACSDERKPGSSLHAFFCDGREKKTPHRDILYDFLNPEPLNQQSLHGIVPQVLPETAPAKGGRRRRIHLKYQIIRINRRHDTAVAGVKFSCLRQEETA